MQRILGIVLQNQLQGCFYGLDAHFFPGSFKAAVPDCGPFAIAVADKNRAHRITVFVAAGKRLDEKIRLTPSNLKKNSVLYYLP